MTYRHIRHPDSRRSRFLNGETYCGKESDPIEDATRPTVAVDCLACCRAFDFEARMREIEAEED